MNGKAGGLHATGRVRRVFASISLVAVCVLVLVTAYYSSQDDGWSIAAVLVTLGVCQCLAVLPHAAPTLRGRFGTANPLVRILAVTSSVLASAVIVWGTWVWFRHHGLVGFREPASLSWFTDEAGVTHAYSRQMTLADLGYSVLFLAVQVSVALIAVRGRVSATPGKSRQPGASTPDNPFLAAALSGDERRLLELRESGEHIDGYDELGTTALLSAVFIGDLGAVRLLLEAGADPNRPRRDDATATPLWHARDDFGLVEIAALLVKAGAHDKPTA